MKKKKKKQSNQQNNTILGTYYVEIYGSRVMISWLAHDACAATARGKVYILKQMEFFNKIPAT